MCNLPTCPNDSCDWDHIPDDGIWELMVRAYGDCAHCDRLSACDLAPVSGRETAVGYEAPDCYRLA